MMYDVPQTDSTSEAAMAALVARFKLAAPKPEAFASVSGSILTDATIALVLSQWVERIRDALGDRIEPQAYLVQWSSSLDAACIRLASVSLYNARGRSKDKSSLDAVSEEEQAHLDRVCRKEAHPRFVTSTPGAIADAPYVASSGRSDDWITTRGAMGSGCCR